MESLQLLGSSISRGERDEIRVEQKMNDKSIVEEALDELKSLGLRCSSQIPCYNMGVRVYKPISTQGNKIDGYERLGSGARDIKSKKAVDADFDKDGITAGIESIAVENSNVDAPPLVLFQDNETGEWVVCSIDGVGGKMPSDFVNVHATVGDAVADIKDFYFGNPARMSAKAEVYREFEQRRSKRGE